MPYKSQERSTELLMLRVVQIWIETLQVYFTDSCSVQNYTFITLQRLFSVAMGEKIDLLSIVLKKKKRVQILAKNLFLGNNQNPVTWISLFLLTQQHISALLPKSSSETFTNSVFFLCIQSLSSWLII